MVAHPGGADRDGRSVDVAINIVPFIDVMSCLVAFLLVTAVGRDAKRLDEEQHPDQHMDVEWKDDLPRISMLVTRERIYLGANREVPGLPLVIERDPSWPTRAWDELGRALVPLHDPDSPFAETTNVEIAAESRDRHVVDYQDLVTAMERAIRSGFHEVGLREPQELMTRPMY